MQPTHEKRQRVAIIALPTLPKVLASIGFMRDRIWTQLANTKFKALYSCECSKVAGNYGRLYSFALAFASCSSVAGWNIWTTYPGIWGFIIIAGSLMHLAKPLFPFSRQEKVFLETSFEFENLYLEYEKLWYAFERNTIDEATAEQRFWKCRQRANQIQKKMNNLHCKENADRMSRIDAKTKAYLSIHFT
jgi:hypothetical protein